MPFDMLTLDEMAKRARISRSSLEHAIKAGAGPALTRIGAKRLVRTDMLTEWLDRLTQQAPQTMPQAAPQQAAA